MPPMGRGRPRGRFGPLLASILALAALVAAVVPGVATAATPAWDWTSPRLVSPARDSRLTALHELASDGKRLHLVHAQIGPAPRDDQVVYQRSTDGGASWTAGRVLFAATDADRYVTPNLAVAASGDRVVVAWRVAGPGRTSLFVRRSADGGATWRPAERVASTTRKRGLGVPALAIGGRTVLLAWTDRTDGRLLLRRSTDGGATWAAARRMATGSLSIECGKRVLDALPGLAVSGDRVHLAWSDAPKGACLAATLRIRSSADGGRTWTDARTASTTRTYGWPELAARGKRLLATLQRPDGSIVIVRSTDAGRTFHERRIAPLAKHALGAADVLLPGGHAAWLVWSDLAYDGSKVGASRIRFAVSKDDGRTWARPITIVPFARRLREAANLAAAGTRPVVVYQSGARDGSTADITLVRAR